MDVIKAVAVILFVVLTIWGYRKNDRKIMLSAGIVLALAFVGLEFALGFTEAIEGV